MREAFEFILNLISSEIVAPIRQALINSAFINNLNPKLNNILSGIFNLFREVPTDKYDSIINNNSIAEFFGVFIAILCFVLFYKIISFGFSSCKKIMNSMLVPTNDKGEWRKQWKRKK